MYGATSSSLPHQKVHRARKFRSKGSHSPSNSSFASTQSLSTVGNDNNKNNSVVESHSLLTSGDNRDEGPSHSSVVAPSLSSINRQGSSTYLDAPFLSARSTSDVASVSPLTTAAHTEAQVGTSALGSCRSLSPPSTPAPNSSIRRGSALPTHTVVIQQSGGTDSNSGTRFSNANDQSSRFLTSLAQQQKQQQLQHQQQILSQSAAHIAHQQARAEARRQHEAQRKRREQWNFGGSSFFGSLIFITGYVFFQLGYAKWGFIADVERVEAGHQVNSLYRWGVIAVLGWWLCGVLMLCTTCCGPRLGSARHYFRKKFTHWKYALPAALFFAVYIVIQHLPRPATVFGAMHVKLAFTKSVMIPVLSLALFCMYREFTEKTKYRPFLAIMSAVPFLCVIGGQILANRIPLDHWDSYSATVEEETNVTNTWLWVPALAGSYVSLCLCLLIIGAFMRKVVIRCEEDEDICESVATVGYDRVYQNLLASIHDPEDRRLKNFFPKSSWDVAVFSFATAFFFFFGVFLLIAVLFWTQPSLVGEKNAAKTFGEAYTTIWDNAVDCPMDSTPVWCANWAGYQTLYVLCMVAQITGMLSVCVTSPTLNIFNMLFASSLSQVLYAKWGYWQPGDGDDLSGASFQYSNSATGLLGAGFFFYWLWQIIFLGTPTADEEEYPLSALDGIGAQIDTANPLDHYQPQP